MNQNESTSESKAESSTPEKIADFPIHISALLAPVSMHLKERQHSPEFVYQVHQCTAAHENVLQPILNAGLIRSDEIGDIANVLSIFTVLLYEQQCRRFEAPPYELALFSLMLHFWNSPLQHVSFNHMTRILADLVVREGGRNPDSALELSETMRKSFLSTFVHSEVSLGYAGFNVKAKAA